LGYLNLSRNSISSLHAGIFEKLAKLKVIKLSNNYLVSLPEIPEGLKYLNIEHNNLIYLPLSICNCKSLTEFYYDNNPDEYIHPHPQLQLFLNRTKTDEYNFIK